MRQNVFIYSAIFGRYDRPKPLPPNLGVRALMITEDEETAELARECGWHTVISHAHAGWSDMLRHKWFKLHPEDVLPEAEITLWVDGSMTITRDDYVDLCLNALGDDDWVMVPHPVRHCIYTEASFSATLHWRYDGEAILRQAEFYRSIGHPVGWGLFATGANVRRHRDDGFMTKFANDWWYENWNRSHQDQVSLPVLVRLAGDQLKWNTNMPWHEWWHISEHGW